MPSLCIVSGNLKTLLGGNANFATVSFQLGNIGSGMIPMVLGTGVFPALTVPVYCSEDGSFSTNLWGNDNITPANTIYLLTFRDQNRQEVGQIQYYINGPSFNINDATPLNIVFPPVLVQVGNINRFEPVLGTPLVASDFLLTGWGAGATISSLTGTDTAFQITITAGVAPTISPTIALTYHDGPWVNPPMVFALMVEGTGSVTDIKCDSTTFIATLTYDGLPEATKTYSIFCQSEGYSILAASSPVFANPNLLALGNIRIIDGINFPFSAAGINAAVANLAGPGTIVVPTAGNYSDAVITIGKSQAIMFGAGQFTHKGIRVPDSATDETGTCSIYGLGTGVTTLFLLAGANVDSISDTNFSTFTGGTNNFGVFRTNISNLTIDGNNANNTVAGFGIRLYGRTVRILNVTVQNANQDGIWAEWNGVQDFSDGALRGDLEWHIENANLLLNGGNGLTQKANSDMILTSSVMWGNGLWGMQAYNTMHMNQVNIFLSGSGACQLVGPNAGILGADNAFTGAAGIGLDTGTSGNCVLVGCTFACPIGVLIGNQNNELDGQFVNCTTAAIKFSGSSAVGNRISGVAFNNAVLIDWNGGGGVSDIYLTGASTGTMFSGTTPGNSNIFINIGGMISPQGGPITGTPAIASGGINYALGDTGYVNAGNQDAAYTVTGESGGAVSAVSIFPTGSLYQVANGVATYIGGSQPGSGNGGLTINVATIGSAPFVQTAQSAGALVYQGTAPFWTSPHTFSRGLNSNLVYRQFKAPVQAIAVGVDNEGASDDTLINGSGVSVIATGSKHAGTGIIIGQGNSTGAFLVGQYINGSHAIGLVINSGDTNAKDVQIQVPANDTQHCIEILNTSQVAIWFVDHTGNTQIGGKVGFYGTAPQAKPTVTGSKGSNAALASLLTALAGLGILTDSST